MYCTNVNLDGRYTLFHIYINKIAFHTNSRITMNPKMQANGIIYQI